MGALLGMAAVAFGLGLSGAVAPGPLLSVVIAESARRGAWAGPLIVLGHGLLEGALVVALFAGVGKLVASPLVFGVVGLVGGAALLWMGRALLRPGQPELELQAGGPASGIPLSGAGRLAGLGILVSLSNPYFTGWWATAGLTQMSTAMTLGAAGVAAFFTGHITSDLAWYSAVSVAVGRGRGLLRGPGYRVLLRVCGVFLLAMGVVFLVVGGISLWGGKK